MFNFYRWFLPAIAGTFKLLIDFLKGNPMQLDWVDSTAAAFTVAKAVLVAAVPLPAPNAVHALVVNASDTHEGATFQ